MPKSHPPYPPEFRRQMVDLVRAGRTPEALSREFEPIAQAIWNWVRQADRNAGRSRAGLSSAKREAETAASQEAAEQAHTFQRVIGKLEMFATMIQDRLDGAD